MLDFTRQAAARTDKGHIAEHDVDEIRQLVDTGAPKKAAERMKPGIVADLKDRAVDFVEMHDAVAQRVRAVDHRAQLEHLEAAAVHADTFLREKRRAPGNARDRERRQKYDRCANDEK